MSRTEHMRTESWAVPVVCALAGLAYLIGGLAGGKPGFAIFGLVLMWGIGVVLILLRGRSETVKGLMDHGDERITAMDLRASAAAGAAIIIATLVAFVADIARGGDGMPYAWLGAVAGVTYLIAIVWQRVRG